MEHPNYDESITVQIEWECESLAFKCHGEYGRLTYSFARKKSENGTPERENGTPKLG